MHLIRYITAAVTATILLSCSGNLRYAGSKPVALLQTLRPAATGLFVEGTGGNPVYVMQSESGKLTFQTRNSSLEIIESYEFAIPPENTLEDAWSLSDGKVLAVTLFQKKGKSNFSALVIDTRTGTKIGETLLNEYSIGVKSGISIKISPGKQAIAFCDWEYNGDAEVTLYLDVYTPDLTKIRSLKERYSLTDDFNNVLDFVVNDSGEVSVIRSANTDGKPQLLVERFGTTDSRMETPLPSMIDNYQVYAHTAAATIRENGDISLAIGMNDDIRMKGLLTFQIPASTNRIIKKDEIAFTSDLTNELTGDTNLYRFTPHTLLHRNDGSFYVIAEAINAYERLKDIGRHRNTSPSRTGNIRPSYYQPQIKSFQKVVTGSIVLLSFNSDGKYIHGKNVLTKNFKGFEVPTKEWLEMSSRLWRPSYWLYRSTAQLLGDTCAVLYKEDNALRISSFFIKADTLLTKSSYSLVKGMNPKRVLSRSTHVQHDGSIIVWVTSDPDESPKIIHIALP